MKDKNIIKILAISGIFLPFFVFIYDIKCVFKTIFHIPCISCGLTRAFICIIHFDFINAIKYNVLSIPIFLGILLFYLLFVLKIILNNNYIYVYYNYLCSKYKLLIIILFIGWIVNLILYVK